MIYSDSRYLDGALPVVYREYSGNHEQAVYRTWPSYTVDYRYYTVNEIDRIEGIASKFLGNPELWWMIMDVNPEILNPFEIPPGTQLRIPNE
jgi:nucleoid-associated protein YgaU